MQNISFKIIMLLLSFVVCNLLSAQKTGITYAIQSAVAGKFLDVKGGKTADGTPLHLWPSNNSNAQKFTLENAGGGYFYIKSALGKYIHVQNRSAQPRALALLWAGKGNDNTKWRFVDAGNGYHYIKSKKGTFLDVQWGKSDNGTPVWLWTLNGGNAQKWKLKNLGLQLQTVATPVVQTTFFPKKRTESQRVDFTIGELCPNKMDGHHVAGDDEFGGELWGRASINFCYSDDRRKVYADVKLSLTEDDGGDTKVRAKWRRIVWTAPANKKIVGFNCYDPLRETWTTRAQQSIPLRYYGKPIVYSGKPGDNPNDGAEQKLPGGGFESPFGCNNGDRYTLKRKEASGYPIVSMVVIGDTGRGDVSADRNCDCDSKIVETTIYGLSVVLE